MCTLIVLNEVVLRPGADAPTFEADYPYGGEGNDDEEDADDSRLRVKRLYTMW